MSATTLGIDIALGFVIGIVLGLLGGGGSILTVPALVYVVNLPPQTAVTASLVIVGANSAIGALFHRAQGTLNVRVALVFGGSGMMAAYLSAGLSKALSPTALMVAFGLLMLVVGAIMLLRKTPEQGQELSRGLPAVIAGGIGVGVLTGFLGVGGGFLIVPALVMLVGLPIRQAVGTSLIVIAMNSLAGFLGHLNGLSLDVLVVGVFAAAGIAGTFAGARLGQRVKPEQLRALFAVFVIGLALVLLADNVSKLLTI
ncbi:MAG: sulfite exporter TauE/SafE family protein [Anaerolineae bacterium]|nr:sulfite exporter TauE/SafE family protein [Anaerolineae bacterium]